MTPGLDENALPAGWSWQSLAEIVEREAPILYGILQPGPDLEDGIPYVRPTEIVDDVVRLSAVRRTSAVIAARYKRSLLKRNDIVLSIVGTIGKVALVPSELEGGNITQSSVRIRPRPEVASAKYVSWALRSPVLRAQFDKYRLGTAVPRLNVAHVRELRVPVAPTPEQQRIVAEIEKQFTRLDAAVAALGHVRVNLKRYRAAVLHAAFPAAQLPSGWKWTTPSELARREANAICAGPFGTIFKAKDFRESGVPIIFLRHVAAGKYLTSKPGFMDEAKWRDLFKPYSVFGGELLITKLGEPPGACAIYPEGSGPAMVTPDVIKMTVDASVVLPRFLMHYLNSEGARRFGAESAFGTTRLRLTIPMFRQMPIPLPPLAEQKHVVREIERRLSAVEELETVVAADLQRAKKLRQSILRRAFSGNL